MFCRHYYVYEQGYSVCTKCGHRTYRSGRNGRRHGSKRKRNVGIILGVISAIIIGFVVVAGIAVKSPLEINFIEEIKTPDLQLFESNKIASCSVEIQNEIQARINCGSEGNLYFTNMQKDYPIELFSINKIDLFKENDVYTIKYQNNQGKQVTHQLEKYETGKTIPMNVYNGILSSYTELGLIEEPVIQTEKKIYEENDPLKIDAPKFELPKIEISNPTEFAKPNFDVNRLENLVSEGINKQRMDNGLHTLVNDPKLTLIARAHSQDMANRNYMSHYSPEGIDPTQRALKEGYECRKDYGSYYTYGVGENIAQSWLYTSYMTREIYTSYNWHSEESLAEDIVKLWMTSPGHRENILTRTYDRSGLGIAITEDDKVYATQNFC